MTSAELSEPIAQPFLGRYRLMKKIAVGGMAELYLARVTGAGGFEKHVVVKRILPQLAASEELFQMFLDEARIAATLQHPNVVQTYDACDDDGEYFIAMEYLDGTDLRTLRKVLADRVAPLPWEHALYIVSGVAAGLHYAHEKTDLDGQPLGIVHRDVSPQNVFLTREGGVKLVDFGIAVAQNRMTETAGGTLKGKLAYMSPEQVRCERLDRRSDIYSLGILLYELTTGRRLYRTSGDYDLLKQIVEEEVQPPSSFMDFPYQLEEIIMRCLAKDRDQRYRTARDVQQALEEFAREYHLMISSLAFSTFLEPLLEEAAAQMKALRQRRREQHKAPQLRRRIAAGSTPPPPGPALSASVAAPETQATDFDPELDLDLDLDSDFDREPPARNLGLGSSPGQDLSEALFSDALPASATAASDAIPEPIGEGEQRTVRVSTRLYQEMTARERALAARTQESDKHVIRRPIAVGTGTQAAIPARTATPAELPVRPSAPALSRQRAEVYTPQPSRRRSSTIDLDSADADIFDVKLRRRGTALLWLTAFLLTAGAVGWYVINRDRGPASQPAPAPAVRANTGTGTIVVTGSSGAEVWLNLGRSPVDVFAITDVADYRVRIEHPGFQAREMVLDQSFWRRSQSGRLEAVAVAELTAASDDSEEAPDQRGQRAPRDGSTRDRDPLSRPSRLHIESNPTGAAVWLYLGQTPDVRVGNRALDERHELRIEEAGGAPRYLVVEPDDFDAGGEARIDASAASDSHAQPGGDQ